ncbi:MAG: VOC family protein [bacterium]|nr:VOC family protein [bacterium]
MLLDAVRIGADDPAATIADYARLLGVPPTPLGDGGARFALERGAVEIAPGRDGIESLRFHAAGVETPPADFLGPTIEVAPGVPPPAPAVGGIAIDHVVIRSADAERAIALWRDRAGLRLALDRPFPERGLRLLFFRSNGITLELATPLPAPASRDVPDALHGVSYRVADLPLVRGRLVAAGVDVSEVRTGMRPGTIVATVRSHTAGVPTLLLQRVSDV